MSFDPLSHYKWEKIDLYGNLRHFRHLAKFQKTRTTHRHRHFYNKNKSHTTHESTTTLSAIFNTPYTTPLTIGGKLFSKPTTKTSNTHVPDPLHVSVSISQAVSLLTSHAPSTAVIKMIKQTILNNTFMKSTVEFY
jgi:hypothetical protein